MKNQKMWIGREVLYLKQHYKDTPHQVMAERLGRTVISIIGAARRLGLVKARAPSAWNDKNEATLRELWDKGDSSSAIARALGRSFTKNMVIGKAHRLKLTPRMARQLPPEIKMARALASEQRRLAKLKAREAKRLAMQKVVLPAVIVRPDSLDIPFKETNKRQCLYMASEDRLCCGHETIEGLSWCGFHYGVVYRDDRRSTTVAGFNKQSMAYRQGTKYPKSEVQTMDRRGETSLAPTEGPQINRPNPG